MLLENNSVFSLPNRKIKPKKLTDLCQIDNSGTSSVAAAFVDLCLSAQRIDFKSVNRVLNLYFKWMKPHPLFENNHGFLTKDLNGPINRLKFFLDQLGGPHLIDSFSLFLRHLALERSKSDPVAYQAVFMKTLKKQAVSEQKTKIWSDAALMGALAYVLSLSVEVLIVDADAEIPLIQKYAKNKDNHQKILIQLKDGQYRPFLINDRLFSKETHLDEELFISLKKKQVESLEASMDLSEYKTSIIKDNIKMAAVFDRQKKTIQQLLAHNTLDLNDLINIYIEGSKFEDFFVNRCKYIGIEPGSRVFFESILKIAFNEGSNYSRDQLQSMFSEKQNFSDQLIFAIAQDVSMGHLPEDVCEMYLERSKQPIENIQFFRPGA